MKRINRMEMNYSISIAKKEEVQEIWNLENQVSEFKTADNVVIFWPKEILLNCINKEDILFYIVKKKERVIGFSIINLNQSLGKAEIENIYIVKEFRKKGIGKKLLDTIIMKLKNKKYSNVNCLADEAINFY